MNYKSLILIAVTIVFSVNANAALVSRLGGAAYYDDILNITWLTNANLALTNQFGLTLSNNEFDDAANTVGSTGRMTLANAETWLDGMNAANYLGFSEWRLPTADANNDGTVIDCYGSGKPGCEDNEMGHLYWEQGISFTSPAPFNNLQGTNYWSGSSVGIFQRVLSFSGGDQGNIYLDGSVFTMAVMSGDVSAVPVPAAVWLFGSGLVGLVGIARRKKA